MQANISLMPEQVTFMTSTKPIISYVGGVGAGKTFISCLKSVKNAISGRDQLMVGLTYPHARDVIFDTLKQVLAMYNLTEGTHWTANKTNLEIIFHTGRKIYVKSAELGNKLRGYSVADIHIDEAAYLKDIELFNILIGRMRAVEDSQIHLTTSPKGFNWVYDISKQSNCEYIKVSTFKNPFLPDQYIRNMLQQYSSNFIQQELYADFVNLSTGIFDSKDIKILEDDSILLDKFMKGNHKRIRFYDFAFGSDSKSDYSAGVLLCKIDESYIIEDIVRVRQEYNDLRNTIINTAKQDGTDVLIGLERAGTQKAIIDDLVRLPELVGYSKKSLSVSKYGHKLKRILPVSSLADNGQLYISRTCRNKIEFMQECDQLTLDDSHSHDDMVDALASAFILFTNITKTKGYRTNLY